MDSKHQVHAWLQVVVYGSSCPKMALSCVRDAQTGKTQLSVPTSQASHVMLDAHVHTLLFYKVKYIPPCIILLLCATQPSSKMGGVTILLKYALLYYTTIPLPYYSSIPWHTFCLWARWEALSCGREPLCSHAIMLLLSMWKTDVALITPEVAFEMWGG